MNAFSPIVGRELPSNSNVLRPVQYAHAYLSIIQHDYNSIFVRLVHDTKADSPISLTLLMSSEDNDVHPKNALLGR